MDIFSKMWIFLKTKKDRKDKQLETNDNMHKKPIKNIFSHQPKLANQAKMAHFRKKVTINQGEIENWPLVSKISMRSILPQSQFVLQKRENSKLLGNF